MFLYEEFTCCRNVAFVVYWSVKLSKSEIQIILKKKKRKKNNCGNWIRAYTGLFTQVLCTCIILKLKAIEIINSYNCKAIYTKINQQLPPHSKKILKMSLDRATFAKLLVCTGF